MRRNTTFRTAAALTAAAALLAACSEAESSDNDADEASPTRSTPTQGSSAAPDETSAPPEEIDLPDGVTALPPRDPGSDVATLAEGRYRVRLSSTLSFDIDVPRQTFAHDDGVFLASGPIVVKSEVAGERYGVPRDPCTDHGLDAVGATTTDLVEALRNSPIYEVGRPQPVELGGAEGTYLEVRIPPSYDASGCADGVALPTNPDTNVGFEPGYRAGWWILDVEGERVVIQQNCVCSADRLGSAAETVRSITFTTVS